MIVYFNLKILGLYFNVNLLLVLVSIILTTLVLNLHFRGPKTRRVPKWIRKYFIKYLGCLFCFDKVLISQPCEEMYEIDDLTKNGIDYTKLMKSESLTHFNETSTRRSIKKRASKQLRKEKLKPEQTTQKRIDDQLENLLIKLQMSFDPFRLRNRNLKSLLLKEIVRCQTDLVGSKDNKFNKYNKQVLNIVFDEWKILAMIIDRICFFLYLLCLVVTTGLFYVS